MFKCTKQLVQIVKKVFSLLQTFTQSVKYVWRTVNLIILISYIYVVIGMEMWRYEVKMQRAINYGVSNFYNLIEGFIELIHVLVQNGWNFLMFSYMEAFEAKSGAIGFFFSYFIIINIVLRSLISGMIWRVFDSLQKEKK